MKSEKLNHITNENILVYYDGKERTKKDIHRENFGLFLGAAVTVVIIGVLIFLGAEWLAHNSVEMSESAHNTLVVFGCIMMYVVGILCSLVAIRIVCGNKKTRKRNEFLDFFLKNQVRAGWFDGELKLQVRWRRSGIPELYRFENTLKDKMPPMDLQVEEPNGNPVSVVITAYFRDNESIVRVTNSSQPYGAKTDVNKRKE